MCHVSDFKITRDVVTDRVSLRVFSKCIVPTLQRVAFVHCHQRVWRTLLLRMLICGEDVSIVGHFDWCGNPCIICSLKNIFDGCGSRNIGQFDKWRCQSEPDFMTVTQYCAVPTLSHLSQRAWMSVYESDFFDILTLSVNCTWASRQWGPFRIWFVILQRPNIVLVLNPLTVSRSFAHRNLKLNPLWGCAWDICILDSSTSFMV